MVVLFSVIVQGGSVRWLIARLSATKSETLN
jgi:NhaP-type Na+/H+ or K+/H+ antiporter